MRRYSLKQLVAYTRRRLSEIQSAMSIYAEPHDISEALLWLHLRTSDGITHAGWWDSRPPDDNDARTLCGLMLHYRDLQRCRHPNRHQNRTFSQLVPSDTDCMACIAALP